MGFRENLKAELSFSGMLVKELAKLSGIKQNTINNYLNVKKRIPSAENAVKIAKVLGISVERLVTGHEKENVPALSQEARTAARIVSELGENNQKIAVTLVKALRDHEKQR
ncbi:MAG: helix-turn-helix domain-containing protein, partial [Spirochaetales bacterium]|nr:helix-turn-helix domain-containing protein [Spirochaetales bacterium]